MFVTLDPWTHGRAPLDNLVRNDSWEAIDTTFDPMMYWKAPIS